MTKGCLPNPLGGPRPIRAVLFDLDGTLYRQPPMRLLMALELSSLPLSAPRRFSKRLHALRLYRQAQERLRDSTEGLRGSLASAQLELAANGAELPTLEV
jgi:phosphoglycolate phosphatase/putative hydrolase of the HAD superfamily